MQSVCFQFSEIFSEPRYWRQVLTWEDPLVEEGVLQVVEQRLPLEPQVPLLTQQALRHTLSNKLPVLRFFFYVLY